MDKEFYDKYGKEFHCVECTFLDNCLKSSEPLYGRCCEKFLRDKIKDLEAKLAESEKKYEDRKQFCINETRCQMEIINNLLEENNEIKQQLAEKEKEIKYLTKQAKKLNNEAQKYFEDAYCNDFHNQDKIDFAVAELEKVKEKVICGVMDIGNPFWSYFRKDGGQYMTSEDLHNALEQEFTYQIQEQIKEME